MVSDDPKHSAGMIRPFLHHLEYFRAIRMRMRARLPLLLALLGTVGLFSVVLPDPAAADFRLCNRTQSRVGVAIGYKEGENWATEGWWNIAANSCETLLRGDLVARFYYLYAVDYDQGGEWSGKAFMCTRDKEFTIRGVEDCLARGFDRTGFLEVDTKEQKGWTVQLTESNQTGTRPQGAASPAPMPPPAPPARR
ncbi:protein of unknown function [Azorhizobium caulinodans ORS 571]|uniref:Uncharacterized protein n=2 Tax=Azorhizobium caulinodans TaxID=7 RepID=A8ILY2_AZOC5|nr:protein of unknown function [Azorhizobium caulinodans ORS 571]